MGLTKRGWRRWLPGMGQSTRRSEEVSLEHLTTIRLRAGAQAVAKVDQVAQTEHCAVFLTVDDGRVSSLIAWRRNWRRSAGAATSLCLPI